jgi:hypothetical protein
MSDVQNNPIALGLVFGLIVGPMILDDPTPGIGVGMCLGVAFGAAFSLRKSEHQDSQDAVGESTD